MRQKTFLIILVSLGVISTMALVLGSMSEEPDRCTNYHEMRQIHKDTRGEYGWPKGAIRGCD